MAHDVVLTPDVLKKKREALKTKRDSLFTKYTKNPSDYRFAAEIKTIDDEIADCIQQEQKSFERPKVYRQQPLINS